jgi:hypothetical protein
VATNDQSLTPRRGALEMAGFDPIHEGSRRGGPGASTSPGLAQEHAIAAGCSDLDVGFLQTSASSKRFATLWRTNCPV